MEDAYATQTDAEINEKIPKPVLDVTGSHVEQSRVRGVVAALDKAKGSAAGDGGTNRRDADPGPAAGSGKNPALVATG